MLRANEKWKSGGQREKRHVISQRKGFSELKDGAFVVAERAF